MAAGSSDDSKDSGEREEVRQFKELIKFLDDAALDIQTIATEAMVYLDVEEIPREKRNVPLSPRRNLLYDISQLQRVSEILKRNLCPRIIFNPNFKRISEILEKRSYKGSVWGDTDEIVTIGGVGYFKKSVLIELSSNAYAEASYVKLVLEKVEIAETKSNEVTDSLIESTAKDLLKSEEGLVAYEKYKEPLSKVLEKMWYLHGSTDLWKNIAPAWKDMNEQLDLIGAKDLYDFSVKFYEAFEEKYDDMHTFADDKRGFALLRGVLNKVHSFVRYYKPEL